MTNICMDRDKVIEFIKSNTKSASVNYEMWEELIEVILKIIPLLGHYEEEGKKLNFKIALGMDNDMKNLVASSYSLRKYIREKDERDEVRINKIEKMIKEVAIFCEKSADIFLVQKESEIECGIFFSRLTTVNISKESFTRENFIVFEHLYKNKVLVTAKNETLCICMDFDKEIDTDKNGSEQAEINSEYKKELYKKWEGIFERVKRSVHGTICLIVNTNWKPEEDKNFTGIIQTVDLDLRIAERNSVEYMQDFEDKLEIFLSMLNFDGITIIDTNERIRAYNLFCKVSEDNKNGISGGARHRAYENLKSLEAKDRCGYVAIYFQSQEGEMEFFKFPENKSQESFICHYFDANIMGGKDEINEQPDEIKKEYEEIKKNYEEILRLDNNDKEKIRNEESAKIFNTLLEHIDELINAHNGFNNFYNEPSVSDKLCKFIEQNEEEVLEIINNHITARRNLINIVFQCIVGYASGYSWGAQGYLEKIIKKMTNEIWKKYFEKGEYLEPRLFLSIAGRNERWIDILNNIKKEYPDISGLEELKYDTNTCYKLYDILIKSMG